MEYINKLQETRNLLFLSTAGIFILIIGALFLLNKSRKSKTKVITTLLSIALIGGIGYNTYVEVSQEIAHIKYTEAKIAEFEESFKEVDLNHKIEYGTKFEIPLPSDLEVDYSMPELVLGENRIKVKVKSDVDFHKEYVVNVEDTTPPEIKGVKNITTERGKAIDFKKLDITAEDNYDGDITVEFKHNVNFDKEGKYDVNVIAVDSSGNEATETFTVTVFTQPLQSIKFNKTGRIINYYNKGSAGGQRQIDNNPGTATTWTIGQHATTHSNTDGRPTYMAGHYYDAFIPVTSMQVGDTVTVRDHTGHTQVYKATARYLIGVDQSSGSVYGTGATYDKIYSFHGEGIMFQTCVANNPSVMIIVEARPV